MAIVVIVLLLALAIALFAVALGSLRSNREPDSVAPEARPSNAGEDIEVVAEPAATPVPAVPRGDAQKIRVLVCDDSEWYCDLVAAWFELEDDLELAGEAHDRASALRRVIDLQPDVVVLDTMTAGMEPVTVAEVRSSAPRARVLLCSGYPESVATDRLGRADGYVSKDDGREGLLGTLRHLGLPH